MKKSNFPFIRFPRLYLKILPSLNKSELKVLLFFLSKSVDKQIHISTSFMSLQLKLSKRSLLRAIKTLKSKNLLLVTSSPGRISSFQLILNHNNGHDSNSPSLFSLVCPLCNKEAPLDNFTPLGSTPDNVFDIFRCSSCNRSFRIRVK